MNERPEEQESRWAGTAGNYMDHLVERSGV